VRRGAEQRRRTGPLGVFGFRAGSRDVPETARRLSLSGHRDFRTMEGTIVEHLTAFTPDVEGVDGSLTRGHIAQGEFCLLQRVGFKTHQGLPAAPPEAYASAYRVLRRPVAR
jgi:hypothetical protein